MIKSLLYLGGILLAATLSMASNEVWISGNKTNDLVLAIRQGGGKVHRHDLATMAVNEAPENASVFLLADGYPSTQNPVTSQLWETIQKKRLRCYIEYPTGVPGRAIGPAKNTKWERVVVSTTQFGPGLPEMRILMAGECHFLPMEAEEPWLVVAKVAGYDTAVFGLPKENYPILFRGPGHSLIATTKLSGFSTGRFAPEKEWEVFWNFVIKELGVEARIKYRNPVHTWYSKNDPLPENWQKISLSRAVSWYNHSGLLISKQKWPTLETELKTGLELYPEPGPVDHNGDGSLGILEGYSSEIVYNGHQRARLPIRADCQAESAMVYAADFWLNNSQPSRVKAENLLNYLYFTSEMQSGARGNPKHPSFGLISWGAVAPAWQVANYGDDNARTMLATMLAAASLQNDRWDEALLKALIANLRTTGKLGFRGDRVDMGPLERNGWKHYEQASTVNYSPHFEAYSWACFLWAYRHTRHEPFLQKTRTAIKMTMEAYPDKWRWKDNMERAHMLLPLTWLVLLEDTPQHREWTRKVAYDLLSVQDRCGALREQFSSGGGHYQLPKSNEAYGTTETPLIQQNGDPVSDQLYVSGFALLGLHEAGLVLSDKKIMEGSDRLAEYLAKIQIKSEIFPYLDGAWFRAFDYNRWEAWGSSGDVGWGAWCVETGWAQAWGSAIMALRERKLSFWDLTATSQIARHWDSVQQLMAQNSGEPWDPKTSAE